MIKWIRNNGIEIFLLTIFFLYVSYAASWVVNDVFTSVIFAIILIIFFFKKKKADNIIYITLLVWFLINFISAVFINKHQAFSFITLIGVTLRIIMPYLIVKIIGVSFFDKAIKYAYYLSIIGLILFSIQLITPNLFYSLAPRLNFMTQQEQHESGGWYIFAYMFSSWAPDRNCGFAWEPGAYSCIITILLAIHLAKQQFKIDIIAIVFLISIITTFSTSGYLALFLIFVSYIIKKKNVIVNPFYLIASLLIIAFAIKFYRTSDFMKNKIDFYIENEDVEYMHFTGVLRINRLEEFNRTLDQSLNWPFGNGVLLSEHRLNKYGVGTGPNSIASILSQWGWIGVFFFLYSFTSFFFFYSKRISISILLTLSVCFVLFSNPFSMRYIVFALFYYYFLFFIRKNKHYIS